MYKIIILAITLTGLYTKSVAQLDSITMQKLAVRINNELNHLEKESKEEFGPAMLSIANMVVFSPDNNETTATIRKLLLDKKFNDAKALFQWLLPVVNKIALERYFFKGGPLKGDEAVLIPALSKAICPCLDIVHNAGFENMFTDSSSIACIKRVWGDTALFAYSIKKIISLTNEGRKAFFTDLLSYGQINCDAYYNSLAGLLPDDVTSVYVKYWEIYKHKMFYYVTGYNKYADKDSLLKIFPAYQKFGADIDGATNICRKYPNLGYPSATLVETSTFERESTYLVQYTNGKATILGQAVYEVGTHKPLLYVRSLKFYLREKLQNIEKLEQRMPPPPADEK